jgi:multimeric flavodoxin WrbA
MQKDKSLLIVWHSQTGGSKVLADAMLAGAAQTSGLKARAIAAELASAQHLFDANGYLFAFPENLAAISGVMKAFFDRCYYPCLGKIEGRPYALTVCAGSDGSNAVRQAERIATGWRLKKVADSRIVCTHAQTPEAILAPKVIAEAELAEARELGAAMAEGLSLGIF